jgi:aryl carrier-like protein
VQDNFFSLGGDSILSIRVVSMLKSRGIRLDIKDIFQHQNIERLAALAAHHAHLKISKDAADLRAKLVAKGKIIEEGVFS